MTRQPALTPNQRAARVAWYLGQGEGLTEQQIKTLSQSHCREQTERIMATIRRVARVEQDANGIWSWDMRTMEDIRKFARPGGYAKRHDANERARSVIVALLLARDGEVQTGYLTESLAVSRQAIFALLSCLSVPLPIYLHSRSRGVWCVLDLKTLED